MLVKLFVQLTSEETYKIQNVEDIILLSNEHNTTLFPVTVLPKPIDYIA